MALIKRIIPIIRNARNMSTNGVGPPPEHLLKKYQRFQIDDGVPVYLKGGVGDKILLGVTCTLIVIGLTDGLWTILGMALPKKK